ncbi:MAG: glycoside hydrolase [Planctomycetaceae bacterium]|nr:glycoside hydrolase [Planctomycetaceae bacterium]
MQKKSWRDGLVLCLELTAVCFGADLNVKNVPYKPVVIEQSVISKEPGYYCGWPSIGKLPNGRLVVVYSGDRDWHVCPWGKMKMVCSDNNGADWSDIKTVTNTPLDDRDAGLLVTANGTILISWFTSVEFANQKSAFYKTRYAQYARHAAKLNSSIRQEWKGAWLRRSEDNGLSWSDPIKMPFDTPHGPIQLRDGRVLLVTGKGVAESRDDGKSWKIIAKFAAEKYGKLSESHAVELDDGKIIVMSRAPYLKQLESTDGGYTWSKPVNTKINGYPPHLIKLENGWLVVVYGRRSSLPNGQFACISRDGGKTWDTENEITLSIADVHRGTQEELGYPPNWDLGYPCSVLLDDGTIWTVYYQVDKPGEWPGIMGTHWKLEASDDRVRAKQSDMDGHLDAGYQAPNSGS